MDLNDILLQLGIGSKETVHLSVTPGVGLELIQLDVQSRTVKNYAFRPLEYNESLREIADYEAFKNAVLELFDELKISAKCNVVLNLPMVLFGSKELPLMIGDDAVTEALTSEAELSYVFKRYEPVISWIDSNNSSTNEIRKIFYTAMQKIVIDNIRNALAEIGATLSSVEMSLTSILKALVFSGLAEDQMKENITWNLMIINPSGYSITSMIGKNIVDYYEEPLAIKSFDGDDIYNAINASAQITLMSYPANYLYIISETDLVSAELLSRKLQVDGVVNYIDNNQHRKQEIIPASLDIITDNVLKISLEAIGIAAGNAVSYPVKFNFVSSASSADGGDATDDNELVPIKIGDKEFEISPVAARNISVIAAAAILVPTLLLSIGVPMLQKQKQAKLDDINSRLSQVQAQVKTMEEQQNKSNDFDVNQEIKKVLGDNRSKLMAYSALGESVPKKVWVTYFITKDDGKIDIKGESGNVEDVYSFFRNMKESLISTKLRLHKLEMQTDSIDDVVSTIPGMPVNYEFEITNMTETELNPPAVTEQQQTPEKPQGSEEEKKGGLLNNKPLINFGGKAPDKPLN